MKLYLSSSRLGDNPEQLVSLMSGQSMKCGVIVNALDSSASDVRTEIVEREVADMKNLGFDPEELDLRLYFGNKNALEKN
jgi:hypothetical protein